MARLAFVFVLLLLCGVCAGQVSYTLTFNAEWSSENFPMNYPSTAHFSGLVGATHTSSFTMWEDGGISSPGIVSMAESGSKSLLLSELEGTAEVGEIISGGGLSRGTGEVSVSFEIDEDHSFVSVTTMIAPSPDWFVGVSSVNLFQNGEFVDETELDLWAYDAGSDLGTTYTAGNDENEPQEAISQKDDYAFSNGHRVGTFTFTFTKEGSGSAASKADCWL